MGTVRLLILLVLGLCPSMEGQAAGPIYQFPLHLLDLAVEASPMGGVQVAAAPSVFSKQGAGSARYLSLRFHPDSVLAWLNTAAGVLGKPLIVQPDERIQWTRALVTLDTAGHFAVGRSVKNGTLKDTRWLSLDGRTDGWRLELSGQEADSLLQVLMVAAMQSGLGTPGGPIAGRAVDVSAVDQPVTVIDQPKPELGGSYGRVIARYVVGVDGRAEPESIEILLASDPRLAESARKALLRSRFHPAMIAGQPIRQLVEQVIWWQGR